MVTRSKVKECRSVHMTNAEVEGSRSVVKERMREEHSTRIDTTVAVFAHAEGVLIARVMYGDFFRCTIRKSGRKGCRDAVGAIVVVDRVEKKRRKTMLWKYRGSSSKMPNPCEKK